MSTSLTRRVSPQPALITSLRSVHWTNSFPFYDGDSTDWQFPLDLNVVERDHPFLDVDSLQALFRRMATLNRMAKLRSEKARIRPQVFHKPLNSLLATTKTVKIFHPSICRVISARAVTNRKTRIKSAPSPISGRFSDIRVGGPGSSIFQTIRPVWPLWPLPLLSSPRHNRPRQKTIPTAVPCHPITCWPTTPAAEAIGPTTPSFWEASGAVPASVSVTEPSLYSDGWRVFALGVVAGRFWSGRQTAVWSSAARSCSTLRAWKIV